ncbi:Regulating synaptic membrane exocytosis protein 2 [Desmophyllum pertusum]|uniref:Regulating synaptic membrane exocytosis protein 2 n=1 Tax=Desmophyllum pertusum TaxID=174260 RepID=A0A9W9ZU73_9CNID|nr:Regulating synaptic membrane exocytosis protein 2 [Desmophyllum pertusum]
MATQLVRGTYTAAVLLRQQGKVCHIMASVLDEVKVATTTALVCEACRKKTCTRCGKKDQPTFNTHEKQTVRISTPPDNPRPCLHNFPTTTTEPQATKTLHVKSGNGKNGNDDKDDDDGDDDVFEDYNEGTDKYLNFLHDEEQSQRDGSAESYSSVHYSSLDDDSFAGDSQGASGGTFEDVYSPTEDTTLDDQSRTRKVTVPTLSNQGNCPPIHKVVLRKYPEMSEVFGSGTEFGVKVVGGRMCTGGFLGVYVAKVLRGSSAEQYIKEGDQILEWNHTSMVDVSFEKVRNVVAESPQEITLVICHNAASFIVTSRIQSPKETTMAIEEKRKKYSSIKCWSRWSLVQLIANDGAPDEGETQTQVDKKKGQIQLHLWHDPHGNNMMVRVLHGRGLSLQDMPNQELPNPYVLLYLLPNRE